MKLDINPLNTIRLNSFHPLCSTLIGKEAILKYHLPKFIDGSCRREPDFENPFPSITSLCRQGLFAPTLQLNDIIVYITVQGNYAPYTEPHHRLVAILKVIEIFDKHENAYDSYFSNNLPIPKNCMVDNNLPVDFDKSVGSYETKKEQIIFLNRSMDLQKLIGNRKLLEWDNEYLIKSKKWPKFVKTNPLYVNFVEPKAIFRDDFVTIFGKLPYTQNPPKISEAQLIKLMDTL